MCKTCTMAQINNTDYNILNTVTHHEDQVNRIYTWIFENRISKKIKIERPIKGLYLTPGSQWLLKAFQQVQF